MISVIIPCLNEAGQLRQLIPYLQGCPDAATAEFILADGGSQDESRAVAARAGIRVIRTEHPGRAHQMNQAAAVARGDIYYFLHADARPPRSFLSDIRNAVAAHYPIGCYRFQFDSPHPLLKINAFFTRLPFLFCRGGDQSLFVTRRVFAELAGFRDDWIIMEDYDLIERAWNRYRFRVLPKAIQVSARKYERNGWAKVQLANMKVFRMYRRGAGQQEMFDTYRALLR
jgi:rSAM/selenodomain-associated transferase 2